MTNNAQDELDYQELIAKVAEIDKNAAAYMIYQMRKCNGFTASGDLWNIVIWEHTAQGTDYWYNIACKLED